MPMIRWLVWLLGAASIGVTIGASGPRSERPPAPTAFETASARDRDVAAFPAVYVDAPAITIRAPRLASQPPTIHLEVPPIHVRGRKPPPTKPAAKLAQQPCGGEAEGC